jgi:hypothetical protein
MKNLLRRMKAVVTGPLLSMTVAVVGALSQQFASLWVVPDSGPYPSIDGVDRVASILLST